MSHIVPTFFVRLSQNALRANYLPELLMHVWAFVTARHLGLIVHEVEATRGKFTNKMATSSDSVELEFWHKNITKIPKVTNSFVEDFAEKNLPIKATVTRGYKFFHEEYIHDIEGEPR